MILGLESVSAWLVSVVLWRSELCENGLKMVKRVAFRSKHRWFSLLEQDDAFLPVEVGQFACENVFDWANIKCFKSTQTESSIQPGWPNAPWAHLVQTLGTSKRPGLHVPVLDVVGLGTGEQKFITSRASWIHFELSASCSAPVLTCLHFMLASSRCHQAEDYPSMQCRGERVFTVSDKTKQQFPLKSSLTPHVTPEDHTLCSPLTASPGH